MRKFTADLHIHTCLSPCAELDMTPRRIIEASLVKGLDIIALSDHNSAENTGVAVELARDRGITVLPAMEITSAEEVHVLALFSSVEKATAMQEIVYGSLQEGVNDEEHFGYQLVVNERDEILEFNKRLLIGATSLSLSSLVAAVRALGGIAVASHIDREFAGVIGQLGFIPEDVNFDALEISYNTARERAQTRFSDYASLPWITSSDAHALHDIGRRVTTLVLQAASFEEVALALKGYREIHWSA
jgi:hypothetical protein